MRVFKFLATGLIGVSVNLGVFHVLYVLGFPYLEGSIGGFLSAVFVGFLLQKYWTFQDRSSVRMQTQLVSYILLALVNLALNTGIVYLFIEKLGAYYLLAQTIGAAVVALDSFFVYHLLIFKPLDVEFAKRGYEG